MRHTWRWFGPRDPIRPEDIAQTGAQGVVTALHHIPNGQVWTPAAIAQRQEEVARCSDGTPSGLAWEVVESLPVSVHQIREVHAQPILLRCGQRPGEAGHGRRCGVIHPGRR